MSNRHRRQIGRFFLIVTVIVSLLHYYLGVRLLPQLPFGESVQTLGVIWLCVSALAIPSAMLARFVIRQQTLADLVSWLGLTAMGLFSSLLVLTLLRDLGFTLVYTIAPEAIGPQQG